MTAPSQSILADVLVLVVHWHDTAQVRRFARQARADGRTEIVIVDNSRSWTGPSPDGTLVVTPPDNLGYLNGCAFGFDAWQRHSGRLPRWTLVANTDLALGARFVEALRRLSPDSVLAPHVTTSDGTPLNPYRYTRPSRAALARTGRMLARPLVHRLAQTAAYRLWRRARTPTPPLTHMPIYAPHGSLMVFPDRFFSAGGLLRYGGFLYGEEIHVAEQARRLGMPVVYEPSLQAVHHEGTATRHTAASRRRHWHMASNAWLLDAYFAE